MKELRSRWMLPIIAVLLVAMVAGCAQPTPTPVAVQPTAVPTKAAAVEPTTAPTEESAAAFLTVNGQEVTEDELTALPKLEVKATNSNGEEDTYEGYSVLALLESLGVDGATLTLVAEDGYSAEVPVADLNDECILRIRSKGGLSSTMPGLPKSANVKGVVELKVEGTPVAVEPEAPAESESASETVLTLADTEFCIADLEEIGIETKTVETPKGEKVEYTGVSLAALLDAAGAPCDAISLVASDGYSAEVKTADITPDCMLALNDNGGMDAVMPGMDGGAWVRDVVEIAAAEAAGDVETADEAVVTVAGKAFTLAELEAVGLETKAVETPKGEMAEYTGVPIQTLFTMNGTPHEAIVLTASDGYSAEVKTADMTLDCMLALNESGGVDAVMPGMDGGAWVRDVVDVMSSGEPTEGRDLDSADATADAVVTVAGKAFSQADLEALGVVTQDVENKGETQSYTGVSLNAVLKAAGCGADEITLTASDGYAANVKTAEITDECMLSFRSKGGVSSVMPGMPGSVWVKDVVSITPVVAEAPTAEAVVTVANKPFSQEGLEALGVVTADVETKGETKSYTGVSLLSVLSAAGISDGAITLTADDGYSAEVAVADITDECMLSFRSKGGVSSVMPGLSGATWVKGVVEITIVAADGPVSVTDALGRTIELDAIPSRIVVPGKGGWMVGHPLYLFTDARGRVAAMEARRGSVSNFLDCVVPGFAELQHLEMNSGPEAIVPLDPDCILMKSYMKESLGDPLESLGLPVIYLDLESPAKFYDDMQSVGQLFNNAERADEIVAYYQGKVAEIEAGVEGRKKPSVLFIQYNNLADDLGMQVPPMDWMQTIMVETAGGEPVWGEAAQSGGNTPVNFEQIAAWDPDVILLTVFRSDPDPVMADLKADPKWSALTAVQNEQFYAVPMDHYNWDVPDPRWIMGATWMAKTLHPDAFADVVVMDEMYEFYSEMYGMDAAAVDECIVPYLAGDID